MGGLQAAIQGPAVQERERILAQMSEIQTAQDEQAQRKYFFIRMLNW